MTRTKLEQIARERIKPLIVIDDQGATDEEELTQAFAEGFMLAREVLSKQIMVDLDPKISELINKKFWELLV